MVRIVLHGLSLILGQLACLLPLTFYPEGNSSPAGPHPLLRTSRALWAERKPDRDRTPRRQSQLCVCQEPPGAGAHAAGG
ncbi:Hypothetical predicted protein [Marmota monax]|nr:hypothetical protein GHT09_016357 [Marmota monax]KAF7472769.1 hypothetical protein GHT09_016357 [Marmota monax]VTJ60642.1 Hypothetical predicted protein [Marmota monax]